MVRDNIEAIRANIDAAAKRSNRDPKGITLICVTKNRSLEDIKKAIDCGITDIGENRVQEARSKHGLLPPLKWHMIGHLQTNKAKDAVGMFDLIQSVDSLKLAREIDKQAEKLGKVQDILVEVNTSGEDAKFGVLPGDLYKLIKEIILLKNIAVKGLMTMAPMVLDAEEARPCFRKLREIKDGLDNPSINILSMGMTQDYEVAIEEGATMVRIGTAIFKGDNNE